MEQMVNVFVMGKKYEVPASLTIMKALEYAGLNRNVSIWQIVSRKSKKASAKKQSVQIWH